VLAWTPTEAQGPSTNEVVVSVNDGVVAVTNAFSIVVAEVNRAPTLAVTGDANVVGGAVLSLTAAGADADVPANVLRYFLVSGPFGMTVDPVSGAIRWLATGTGRRSGAVGVSDGVVSVTNRFEVNVAGAPLPDLVAGPVSAPTNAAAGRTAVLSYGVTNQGSALLSASNGWLASVRLVPGIDATATAIASAPVVGSLRITNAIAVGQSLMVTQEVLVPSQGPFGWGRFVVVLDPLGEVPEGNDDNNTAVAGITRIGMALQLELTVARVPEDGSVTSRAIIQRHGDWSLPLMISIGISDSSELGFNRGPSGLVATNVLVPAGQGSAAIEVRGLPDGIVDGTQPVIVSATAPGYLPGSAEIEVSDVDLPRLTVIPMANSVVEGRSIGFRVTRDVVTFLPLTVQVTSSNPGQLSPPTTMVIPGGMESADFSALAVDDGNAEPATPYSITASAAGHHSGQATILVEDNDVPSLVVTLSTASVSEGDGPQALSMTVTREPIGTGALAIEPFASDPNLAVTPLRITIPAGQASRSFPIGVVEDRLVNGDRTVTLGAFVLGAGSGQRLSEARPASLTVRDNDGPTLTLLAAQRLVPEGRNPATLVALSRNTPPTNSLVVTLSVSATNEASVPLTVLLPVGVTALDFPLVSLLDGVADGNKPVTITAEATGFTPGLETVVVSDTDLPDLVVQAVDLPAGGTPQQRISVTYRLANTGLSPTVGGFLTRVYLSRDSVVGDDVLVAQFRNTEAVAVGEQLVRTEAINLPVATGDYWVVVETDAEQTLAEVLEDNNVRISNQPIAVRADYGAWVATDVERAPAGSSVLFHGRTTNSVGAAVGLKSALIRVRIRGIERVFSVTSDASGNFTYLFQTLPGEAGRYEIVATHPGVSTGSVQDSFELIGFKVDPDVATLGTVEATAYQGSLAIENLGDVPLNGFTISVTNLPPGLEVVFDTPPQTLAAFQRVGLNYRITPSSTASAGTVQVRISTQEGASRDLRWNVQVEPLRARLVALPASLEAGMVAGGQAIVEFDVVNFGGRDSGPVQVLLPGGVAWMNLVTTNVIPNIPVGTTNRVTIALTPPRDLPLGPYTGTLALNAETASATLPFSFRAISTAVGDLLIDAVTEFTYYAEGAPHLAGANVTIRDAVTRTNVVTGMTDTNGHFYVSQLPENYYEIEVTADRHSGYRATHLLKAGITNEVQAFLSRQTVTYNWTVDPVQIDDQYRITVDTTFETAVPAPVVTLDPPLIDLRGMNIDAIQVNLTVENHGLVAAEQAGLYFSEDPEYEITPAISELGSLPPRSQFIVPIIIRKKSVSGFSASKAQAPGLCIIEGGLRWYVICGVPRSYNAPTRILPARFCGFDEIISPPPLPGPVLGPVLGAPSVVYGPNTTTGTGIDLCDPCLIKRWEVTQECVAKFIPCNAENPAICWYKCGNGAYDCVNGLLSGVSLNGVVGCAKTVVNCAKAAGKTIPGPWKYLKFVECACELYNSCNGMPGHGNGVDWFCVPFVSGTASSSMSSAIGKSALSAPSGNGSVGFNSEFDRLRVLGVRLRQFIDPTIYFFGSDVWFKDEEAENYVGWIERFLAGIEPDSSGGELISSDERIGLLSLNLPMGVSPLDANQFLDRWNRSFSYWRLGIFETSQVPQGQSADFIDIKTWAMLAQVALAVGEASARDGVEDPAEALYNEMQVIKSALEVERGGGVCARVKIRLEQEAVVARDAFRATLELDNNGPSRLENVRVEVEIRDDVGRSVTNLFAARFEGASVLSAADGTGILAGNSTGIARWLLIPTVDAAPEVPTRYLVGGRLSYRLDGVDVSVDMTPVAITVMPSPRLTLQYFHQRDVLSDDPFTPQVEPAVPYSLALMVQNRGFGQARNFRITSAQPRIIENDKGLLIDFNIAGTEVFGADGHRILSPSLTASLGDIPAGGTGIGRWLMTSSLQGLFIDYSARFEHVDGLGNARLSLIDEVSIHEMNRVVQAGGIWEDGRPDFLVNDVADPRDLPDTLYQSNGSTNRVSLVESATLSGTVGSGSFEVTMDARMPGGWAYLRVADPGNGEFQLARVQKGDGTFLGVGTNAWTTDRTFRGLGQRPLMENVLHLLDYNSDGHYVLTYTNRQSAVGDAEAPTSSVAALPEHSREYFQVTWSGRDVAPVGEPVAGIGNYDIYVSENGAPYVLWMGDTTLVSATYLGHPGSRYAFYSVATDGNGNRESIPEVPDATTFVSVTNRAPVLTVATHSVLLEGETLDLAYEVSDPDEGQSVSLRVVSGPPGLVIDPIRRRVSWGTGELQGPSTNRFVISATDNDVSSRTVLATIEVVVLESNQPPTFANLENVLIPSDSVFRLDLGLADPDLPPQPLNVRLLAGPVGLSVTNGILQWTPSSSQGPSTNRVVFAGSDGIVSVTNSLVLTVTVSNTLPTLAGATNATINALVGYTQNLAPADVDIPVQTLTVSLVSGPEGLVVTNGVVAWTPTEAQGPSTNEVVVTVTDGVGSVTNTFTLVVRNWHRVVRAPNTPLRIPISSLASDGNGNPVTLLSLGASSQGATLSFDSTYIYYLPANNNSDTVTYTVSNGSGTASGSLTISTITDGGIIRPVSVAGGTAVFRCFGIPGLSYDVQRTTSLSVPVSWSTIGSALTPGIDGSFTHTDSSAPDGVAYYRLVQH
jgi:CARDB